MPVLLYDGDCGFCRRWIERWRRRTGGRVEYVAFQEGAGRFPSLPKEALREAVHWVGPDGKTASGAEAVFRACGVPESQRPALIARALAVASSNGTEGYLESTIRSRASKPGASRR